MPLLRRLPVLALMPLLLTAPPAVAGDAFDPPTGRLLTITDNTLLYASPPVGLLSRAEPLAILGPDAGALQYYPVDKSPQSDGYQLAAPTALPAQALSVTGYRDLVMGKETVRWLQVSPVGQPSVSGWVPLGTRSAPDPALTLQ